MQRLHKVHTWEGQRERDFKSVNGLFPACVIIKPTVALNKLTTRGPLTAPLVFMKIEGKYEIL